VEEKKRRTVLVSFAKTVLSLFPLHVDGKHAGLTRPVFRT